MQKKKIYKGIGIMSGTSLDGLDVAYAEYWNEKEWFFTTGPAATIKYPADINNKLRSSMEMDGEELTEFDITYGKWIGEQVNGFIKKNKLSPDFIASHGHTVFHQPEKGFTLQIGNGTSIHAITGIPVVYNFRNLDVALGGQGAPLVPVGDALLFEKYDYCLNLGGIANISKTKKDGVLAYDICAANMVLNHLAQRNNQDYDADGKTAAGGNLIEPLLRELDNLPFLQKTGPRSLGYEHVSSEVFPLLSEEYIVDDLLHTYCHHIAKQVGKSLKQLDGADGHILLVTGGGARNKFLVKLLKQYCTPVKIEIPKVEIIDFKEALVFSFLGLLRLRGEKNVWSDVTGSSYDSCSGVVAGHFQNI